MPPLATRPPRVVGETPDLIGLFRDLEEVVRDGRAPTTVAKKSPRKRRAAQDRLPFE